jgi:hypothetical protein
MKPPDKDSREPDPAATKTRDDEASREALLREMEKLAVTVEEHFPLDLPPRGEARTPADSVGREADLVARMKRVADLADRKAEEARREELRLQRWWPIVLGLVFSTACVLVGVLTIWRYTVSPRRCPS